jgi:hypothetical protein
MCCKTWPLWLGLIGLCVVGAVLRCPENSCRAQPPAVVQSNEPAPPKEPNTQPKQGKKRDLTPREVFVFPSKPPAPPEYEVKAEGYGVQQEDATEDAVKDACHKIQEYLASKYGEKFTPTEAEVKAKQIVGQPEFETADNLTLTQEAARKPVIKAIVPVKLSAEQVKDFREEARKFRVGGRMKTTGVILAGLIALLLVGGGYLRLEEATKGYYTTLLRVGAVAILGTILALLAMTKPWS